MAAVREERRLVRERKQARVWVDPRAVFVCTNLKHWKMGKKKIFRKIYRIGGCG